MLMTRREAVIKMAVLMGATAVGPSLLAASFSTGTNSPARGFSAEDVALLDEIGDTIIPTTDIPGAKAVGIGAFMAMMVNDCYNARDQANFKDGLKKITAAYTAKFGGEFVGGDSVKRTALLNELDHEQKVYTGENRKLHDAGKPENSPHYFRIMKELTVLGYFSSEVGCIKAVRFTEVPGRYDGSAPYKPGEHGWFSS